MRIHRSAIARHAGLFSACLLAIACTRADAPAARADTTGTATTTRADTTVPSGPMGLAVRRGHALLAATRDSLPSHVGSSLRCFSCHLDEGRRASALPLTGSYTRYPQYRARRARVDLIEDRVNDCFVRSLNGKPLASDGSDMRDIVAFLAWLSRGAAVGESAVAHGVTSLSTLEGDSSRGRMVFEQSCTRCHGATGEGAGIVPPVWGPRSYNIGAGMARYRTAAQFILHNMPFDHPNTLTPQQALDVARYVDSQPRPDLAGKENDWPTGERPPDVPYPTRTERSSDTDTARTRAHSGAR